MKKQQDQWVLVGIKGLSWNWDTRGKVLERQKNGILGIEIMIVLQMLSLGFDC